MRADIHVSRAEGTASLPPSKSMAHRAVLAAALAGGESVVENLQLSKDIQASLEAAQALGARVELEGSRARIWGADPFAPGPAITVDCCESGSTLRFLVPILALSGRPVTLIGHGRLMQRPMEPYEQIFRTKGLLYEAKADRLELQGPLPAGEYRLRGDVSSQFITGLLLALPLLKEDSRIFVEGPLESSGYVELTRAAQQAFGVKTQYDPATSSFWIPGGQQYRPAVYPVPADDSQAAFLAVLGAVQGGLTLTGLSPQSGQPDGVIVEILARCKAGTVWEGDRLTLRPGPLTGTRIDLANCPDLGPILMVLGLFCKGETQITNAGRLRLKESDRIAAMEEELKKFGAAITSTEDTVTIQGGPLHPPTLLQGHNDHRVVMALTIAALAAGLPAQIEGAEAVSKSWPTFFEEMRCLGADIEEVEG